MARDALKPSSLLEFAAFALIVSCAAAEDGVLKPGAEPAPSTDAGVTIAPEGGPLAVPSEAGVVVPSADASHDPSCANGLRDGDETDSDCGGALCPACANGRACAASRDCVSLVCASGKCSTDVGCSDGTREGFTALATFPNIAACAGAWSIAGLATTTNPACAHASGNGSANPSGAGCNVADLCQVGWHVCATPVEVGERAGGAGCGAASVAGQSAFFVIRQSGDGGTRCSVGTNDLFGCGDVGLAPDATTCTPLDRFSNDLCTALPKSWSCGLSSADEATNVTKTSSDGGGVLCCRD